MSNWLKMLDVSSVTEFNCILFCPQTDFRIGMGTRFMNHYPVPCNLFEVHYEDYRQFSSDFCHFSFSLFPNWADDNSKHKIRTIYSLLTSNFNLEERYTY